MSPIARIKNIFGTQQGITIGAVHLPPLVGYPDFPGLAVAERNALRDLSACERGGSDAIIFENNYDNPHHEFVSSGVAASLALLGKKIVSAAARPVGISVLWNDYPTALAIAKLLGLLFIRVPVFVDRVQTAYGVIQGKAKDVIALRRALHAEDIAVFTDIHVKHAKMLSAYTLSESALRAIDAGSDGLIITGKWTGDAPDHEELAALRKRVGAFPVFAGSGANQANIALLRQYVNGVIISTALKAGRVRPHETNMKAYAQRISEQKVQAFVRAYRAHKE